MALYVAAIDKVKEACGGAAIIQHHSGHGSAERERGSSVLGGAADTIVALREKDDALELACEKQKDSGEFDPILLKRHQYGESCVLKLHNPAWNDGGFLRPIERNALQALHESFLEDGASASAWRTASEMPDSSFYKARTSLVRRRLVDPGKGRVQRYTMTKVGADLLKLHGFTVTP